MEKKNEEQLITGLTSQEVNQKIQAGLVNKTKKRVSKSYLKIFTDNVLNFFNVLLILIAIVMFIAQLSFTKFLFLFILGFNIIIGLIQDIHARRLTDKLKVLSESKIKVIRDAEVNEISEKELVLNDVIILKAGDQIPCDSNIIYGSVEVNESILTGESINVNKTIGNQLFSGTYVVSGTAYAEIVKVGKDNYAEQLQEKAKKFKTRKSQVLSSIKKIFFFLGVTVITLGTALVISYATLGLLEWPSVMKGSKFQDSITQISWSLVSMLPIGMYLLTSLTLAVGVIRLAKRKMLVQDMYCIETLARVDVLCLDKTGTITDGNMSVTKILPLGKKEDDIKSILYTLVTATEDKNATAKAILNDLKSEVIPYHSGVAFNSERKYSAVNLTNGKSYLFGAREFIVDKNDSINKTCEEYENQGYRVLVICESNQCINVGDTNIKSKPVGIIVLEDHIKEDAIKNIEWFSNNDVAIKIISGDNPNSVSVIAKKVGVPNAEKCISLDGMSLEEVEKIANEYTVFGRVSPEQKEVIIQSLQNHKHTVAMVGDGVNDILALKKADCSIAMASGSDAAKNVATLVSLDSNFSSLPNVVSEGRRVINNLQRSSSLFLSKTIFAILITIVSIVMTITSKSPFIPFSTNNMIVWEMLTIGLAGMFLSLQPSDERIKDTFFSNIISGALPAGLTQSIITIVILLIGKLSGSSVFTFNFAVSMAIIVFSLTSFFTVIRISIPYDIYRGILSIGVLIAIGIYFIIDIFGGKDYKVSLIGINYNVINQNNWFYILIFIVAGLLVYVLLDYFINLILGRTKHESRN